MIEYGIVVDFEISHLYLVFKRLFISYDFTIIYSYVRIYHFKKNVKYCNENNLFIAKLSEINIEEIKDIDYNIIFNLNVSYDRIYYEHKETKYIIPHKFKYYIISITEQI